jgi:hypothetical protein
VTPATTHLTFVYLGLYLGPARAAPDKVTDRIQFLAAHMVELKQHGINLAAINTRVRAQIFEDALNQLGLGGATAAGDVGDVTSFVPGVPLTLDDSLALFTLRAQTIKASLI